MSLLLLLSALFGAVRAACSCADCQISTTLKGCEVRHVRTYGGVYDITVRVATTDGLSGVRIWTGNVDTQSCYPVGQPGALISALSAPGGVSCFEATASVNLCRGGVFNITLALQPFDLDYVTPIVYNVSFANRVPCPTPQPTPRPTPWPPLSSSPRPTPVPPTPIPRQFTQREVVRTDGSDTVLQTQGDGTVAPGDTTASVPGDAAAGVVGSPNTQLIVAVAACVSVAAVCACIIVVVVWRVKRQH